MVEKPTAINGTSSSSLLGTISPLVARSRRSSPNNVHHSSPITYRSSSIKKLNDQDHFHYSSVELGAIRVVLISFDAESFGSELRLQVESNGKQWRITRNITQIYEFDRQLHRCVFDRTHSRLSELTELQWKTPDEVRCELARYLNRFSQIAGSLINCFPVLKFLEVDSRGNRFLAAERTPINTPAIASAIVTKNFDAQSCDQISLRVGDIVSVIEKASPDEKEESSWWKAKLTITKDVDGKEITGQNFEVGIFPSECVKIFDGKSELRCNGETTEQKKERPRRHRDRSLVRALLRRHVSKNTPLFGTDLVEYLQKTGEDVPIILKKCVEVIETHGIVTGVYRQCGIQSNIQKLRNGFDSGRPPDLKEESILKDIHSVSSLLKQYFRQLPNPLFTFELYPDFVGAYETSDEKRATRFKNVITRLPLEHYRTAKYLIRHLSKLCQCTHLTDMNSKNLAIVWAPNLFRCPPSRNGGDSSLLQGLNAQTGLCNYILVHAVYLFSLEKESLSLPRDALNNLEQNGTAYCAASPDLRHRQCIDVNGGPATLRAFHTVLDRPTQRHLSEQSGKWRRMLHGPSVDNAFASLRTRWRKHGKSSENDISTNSVKWRSSRSSSSDVRASLRAARSASLITFVTKSVEEFRNGVLRSWRHCAPNSRGDFASENGKQATAIATEIVKRRGLTSFLANDQQPSTSTDVKADSVSHSGVLEGSSVDTESANSHSSTTRGDCADDGVSLSSDSYRFFGYYEDEHPSDDSPGRDDHKISSKEIQYNSCSTISKKSLSKEDLNTSSDWSGSRSSGSLHNDRSRYDNVSANAANDDEERCTETPQSFYDLPQSNMKPVRSNVQLFFL